MIANEHPQHYDGVPSIAGEDTVDFANDMEIDHDYDVLPTIAAENAALKVKLKQECDIAHVTRNNISKGDIRIESLKRHLAHCDELLGTKSQELAKLQEELSNLIVSREHIKSNADNLKRQHELITIEDQQRRKEQDSVRSNYEKMIKNRKEIFNSNRLVVRRNNLRNQCEGARIQSAVLEERLKELHRQQRQFREIQNLHLKSASVELAQEWVNNRKEKERINSLRNQLREKKESYNQILSQKNKVETTSRSPGSRFVGLPMPTFSQPLHIPSLNAEETELTKYFRKINVFKKSRSPCLLPNVLSRAVSLKERESNSPKFDDMSRQSPVKKNPTDSPKTVDEIESKTSETPKLSLENASKTSAFQPVNAARALANEIVEIELQAEESTSNTEKPRQTPTSAIDNHAPNSPGKVNSKFKPVEKYVSPLTVSRASPLNTLVNKSPMRTSRIPVPLSTSSPIHAGSHPVRFSPIRVNQKRDYVEKETISKRFDNVKKIERSSPLDIEIDTADLGKKSQAFKRSDVGSPKRSVKMPKMDYAYLNANRNLSRGAFDSGEIPTIEVEEDEPAIDKNYRGDDLNVDALIDEVNNENNPMIRSHFERMKMIREEYSANEMDDIELLKKSAKESNKPEAITRETYKTDNRLSNRNVSRGMPDSEEIPTIRVDQIEQDSDQIDPTMKPYLDQLKMLREEHVNKNTWKDRHEAEDNEMLKKLAKNSKGPELSSAARDSYNKLDTRHFIRNQPDLSNRHGNEYAKHYEKLKTNLYRREPKDFRGIEKADLEMNSKNSNSRFDKLERGIEKLTDEGARAQSKYNDLAYSTNSDFIDSSEKLSKSSSASSSSLDRNRSDVISPFGAFTSPPGSNKSSPPFRGAMGERGGSMFGYDSGVNQLFSLTADGSSSQSQNQNNGFFNFNFGSSLDQNDQPLKMF